MPSKAVAARGVKLLGLLSFCLCEILIGGCGKSGRFDPADDANPPANLSALRFFEGDGHTQQPAEGVVPYDLNSALFSDYTTKYRFVKLPPGSKARYDERSAFNFPVGTMIAKTFAYPHDMRDPTKGQRLLETRVLMHRRDGWAGFAYIWNEKQNEAQLEVAGDVLHAEWIHTDGTKRSNDYLVPNVNQCKQCHKAESDEVSPIGPKARHLNRDFIYYDQGRPKQENQLVHWTRVGILSGAPADPHSAPRLAAWDNEQSGTLDQRARAWLEINCAHCHNPGGHARNTGLDLMARAKRGFDYGIFKAPVAAGRGSGGLKYDIVPGKPEESILLYRIASTQPEAMMPELGKRLVHTEGVELIRQWIASLPVSETETTAGQ